MDPNRSVLEACDGTDVFGASWEDFGGVGWISEKRKVPRKNIGKPLKIRRWLMGVVRDPYVAVWAGIDPSRNRLMIRMGLGGSGRILGFPIFGGFRRKLVFRFSTFFRGADGAQGGRGWAGT